MQTLYNGLACGLALIVIGLAIVLIVLLCNKVEKYHNGLWSALLALGSIGFFLGVALGR